MGGGADRTDFLPCFGGVPFRTGEPSHGVADGGEVVEFGVGLVGEALGALSGGWLRVEFLVSSDLRDKSHLSKANKHLRYS